MNFVYTFVWIRQIFLLVGFRTYQSIIFFFFNVKWVSLFSTKNMNKASKKKKYSTGDTVRHKFPSVVSWMDTGMCIYFFVMYFFANHRRSSRKVREWKLCWTMTIAWDIIYYHCNILYIQRSYHHTAKNALHIINNSVWVY